eukprot:PhM_4_TR2608/c0_g2_i1/m.67898
MYQNYVDDLTRALRAAEASHLDSNDVISKLPDPCVVIDALCREKGVVEAARHAESQYAATVARVEELEAELSSLQNQETQIMSLQEELQEQRLQTDKGLEAQRDVDAVERRAEMLQKDLSKLEEEVVAERARHKITQDHLLEWRQRAEEAASGSEMNYALVVNEMEAVQAMCDTLQGENTRLRKLMAEGSSHKTTANNNFCNGSGGAGGGGGGNDDALVFALHSEVQQLKDELVVVKAAKLSLERRNAGLEESVSSMSETVRALRSEPNNDTVPRAELEAVKERHAVEVDDVRRSLDSSEQDRAALRRELTGAHETVDSLRAMVTQLEDTLQNTKLDNTDDATLGVVVAQRERYKTRALTAEAALGELQQTMEMSQQEILGLKADNDQLASRLHVVQQAANQQQHSVTSSSSSSSAQCSKPYALPGYHFLLYLWATRRGRTALTAWFFVLHFFMLVGLWQRLHQTAH